MLLQILSNNTRRTKVVELSTGTHRVPDELRKHYLSDGEGGQYSTNLDRNRYGNDDQYLFTGELLGAGVDSGRCRQPTSDVRASVCLESVGSCCSEFGDQQKPFLDSRVQMPEGLM